MTTKIPHLDELIFEQVLGAKRRLLYTERAGAILQQLTLPAYRAQIAAGRWPLVGPLPQSEYLIELVQLIAQLTSAKQTLLSQRDEEEVLGKLLLRLFAYASGRKLNLGAAMVRVHLQELKNSG